MMRKIPYEVRKTIKFLNDMGYNVDIEAYKPGNQVLYRIVKLGKNGSQTPLTPYLSRKELTIWCRGFTAYPEISDGVTPLV